MRVPPPAKPARRFGVYVLALCCIAAAGLAGLRGFGHWVKTAPLPPLVSETSATVIDRNGRLLRAFTVADGRWRLPVRSGAVDPLYAAMLIAHEDRRFHRHHGVDPLALIRAAGQAVRHFRIVSGGSTLTMQVARLLTERPTRALSDKIAQIRLALALERRLSKEALLQVYFERAPFGGNLEGVRAASLSYFGKEPKRLTPAEAALLVALPQSPEIRRPDRFAGRARLARDRVLKRAAENGIISGDAAQAALSERVPNRRRPFPILAAHLAEDARLKPGGPSPTIAQLTLDRDLQLRLETLVAGRVGEAGARLSGAVVVADHRTGEILASVGSAGYADMQRGGFIDMTRAARSPGSTLKPFIYALAFDAGLAHPESLVEDRPTAFANYVPENFDRVFRGTVTIREALQLSLNVPAVAALDSVGPVRLMDTLRRSGARPVIPDLSPLGLAIGLGGVGISLRDLVSAYTVIARGGEMVRLRHTKGKTGKGAGMPVLGKRAAWHVADILKDAPAPQANRQGQLAFKTGTSYGYRDAWAVGFDGRHVIGVWMGRPDGTPVPGLSGIAHAAPLLFSAFSRLKPVFDPLPPAPPGTLDIAHSDLPGPLKWLRHPALGALSFDDSPEIAFPPDGAEVEIDPFAGPAFRLALKVRNGAPPFTWLVNGQPIATGAVDRQALWPGGQAGFHEIAVIDKNGRIAKSRIRMR